MKYRHLAWSDEFDKTGLPDPKNWTCEVGLVRNNELQYYTERRAENARVEDGRLIIEASREPWEGAAFTSASLTTQGLHSWSGGRIEARAKLPPARGTWPAFWTLGTDIDTVGWPRCGEIDIMEYVGHEPGTRGIYGNVHYGEHGHIAFTEPRDFRRPEAREARNPLDLAGRGFLAVPAATETFHTYAIEWDEDRIEFFVGETNYLTYRREDSTDGSWPFDKPHYIILNLAVGGAWGGHLGVDDNAFPQRFEIEHVRVFV